ncbi:MAG: hypothetical protein JNG88_06450 [Phycisphaerales bacterium]|nr:hypothetical protein [Phycisphaerales bacterium]
MNARFGAVVGRKRPLGAALAMLTACLCIAQCALARSAPPRIDEMNRAFLESVKASRGANSKEAELLQRSLNDEYSASAADSFIPDALAIIYPAFRAGIEAFDKGDFATAQRAFEPLAKNADAYVSANAMYYYARSLVERGLTEEAEEALALIAPDAASLEKTPYAAHLLFLKGYSQGSNLRFSESIASLKTMIAAYPHAPEAITVGARQLLVEMERREDESLDEVSHLMDYASRRLTVNDAGDRVRERQDKAVELLDRLIEEEQKKEGDCKGGGGKGSKGGKSGKKKGPARLPQSPAEESAAPEGSADVGELHNAPRADPEQSWGNLPPSEREKILQSLRERFPSRYRHLVEQYYRSLAEQK